MGTIDNKVEFD